MDWNGSAKYYKVNEHESHELHESKDTAAFVRFEIFVVKNKSERTRIAQIARN